MRHTHSGGEHSHAFTSLRMKGGRSIDQNLLSVGEMGPPNAGGDMGLPPSAFAHHDRFFGRGGWDTEVVTVSVP